MQWQGHQTACGTSRKLHGNFQRTSQDKEMHEDLDASHTCWGRQKKANTKSTHNATVTWWAPSLPYSPTVPIFACHAQHGCNKGHRTHISTHLYTRAGGWGSQEVWQSNPLLEAGSSLRKPSQSTIWAALENFPGRVPHPLLAGGDTRPRPCTAPHPRARRGPSSPSSSKRCQMCRKAAASSCGSRPLSMVLVRAAGTRRTPAPASRRCEGQG